MKQLEGRISAELENCDKQVSDAAVVKNDCVEGVAAAMEKHEEASDSHDTGLRLASAVQLAVKSASDELATARLAGRTCSSEVLRQSATLEAMQARLKRFQQGPMRALDALQQ
jgi:hypothetical protein